MTSELKTCPFCGGDAEYYTDNGPTGEVYGWVGCNQCDAMSCHIDVRSMQPEEAHPIDAWNTRTEQAAELAKFKALAETLAGALPDDIDLFRIIRAAGRSNAAKAQAVYARLSEALRQYKEARDD